MNSIYQVPTIILTYLSFCTFLLDLRIGERLGFGMALALVVVAQQIVTTGMTPVSDQRLWLDKFVAWSFYWVLFGVVQSVFIGFLFYVREDRQAQKENKRLTMMSVKSRKSMMKRAAAEQETAVAASEENSEEERMMLAHHEKESAPPETSTSSSDEHTSTVVDASPSKDGFIYTFSLRKWDFLSLILAIVTYSAFIVVMFSTGQTDVWLRNEPKWFSEENESRGSDAYDSNDPNN